MFNVLTVGEAFESYIRCGMNQKNEWNGCVNMNSLVTFWQDLLLFSMVFIRNATAITYPITKKIKKLIDLGVKNIRNKQLTAPKAKTMIE